MNRFSLFASAMVFQNALLAHAPYERAAGTFTRSDGVQITAVKYFSDGILGSDPVSVKFRLPDASVVTQTEHTTGDVVVRAEATGFTVFRFPSDWMPVASTVEHFDGFNLSDATTTSARAFSVLVHTRANLKEYCAIAVLLALLVLLSRGVSAIPNRGNLLASLRFMASLLVGVYAFCVLVLLLVASVSPLILSIPGAIGWVIYRTRRKVFISRQLPDADSVA